MESTIRISNQFLKPSFWNSILRERTKTHNSIHTKIYIKIRTLTSCKDRSLLRFTREPLGQQSATWKQAFMKGLHSKYFYWQDKNESITHHTSKMQIRDERASSSPNSRHIPQWYCGFPGSLWPLMLFLAILWIQHPYSFFFSKNTIKKWKERKTWRWHNGTLNKDELYPILLFSNQQDLTVIPWFSLWHKQILIIGVISHHLVRKKPTAQRN